MNNLFASFEHDTLASVMETKEIHTWIDGIFISTKLVRELNQIRMQYTLAYFAR